MDIYIYLWDINVRVNLGCTGNSPTNTGFFTNQVMSNMELVVAFTMSS
jgi:hypothetical protein